MLRYLPPRRLRSSKLDDIEKGMRECLASIGDDPRAAIDGGEWLTIYGPEGVGKSFAMAALHMALAAKRWQVGWLDCANWPDDLFQSKELLEAAKPAPILLLDDVGREPERYRGMLSNLIHYRADAGGGFLTVITTNLDIDEDDITRCKLTDFYGRAARSRFLSGTVAHMDGRDRRSN